MSEVIIFAGLIGIICGAIQMYHSYIIAPHREARKQDILRIRALLSGAREKGEQLSNELETTRRDIEAFKLQILNGGIPIFEDGDRLGGKAPPVGNYGDVAKDDEESDNDAMNPMGGASVFDEIEQMRDAAQDKLFGGQKLDVDARRGVFQKVLPPSFISGNIGDE